MQKKVCAVLLCLSALAILYTLPQHNAAQSVTAPAHIEGDAPVVALTFDDGPRADTTSRLLDGLRERGAHATFFLIGEQIEGNENLVLQMAVDGHQIGNHTFTHHKLQGSGRDTIIQEINKTEVALSTLLDGGEYWLRPPYGLINAEEKKWIQTPMVYWSVDPEDWKLLDAQKVTERVCAQVKDGDIILLHDFYPTSVTAALNIVDRLQAQGYEFVTVEELMRQKGTQPQAGILYSDPWTERN